MTSELRAKRQKAERLWMEPDHVLVARVNELIAQGIHVDVVTNISPITSPDLDNVFYAHWLIVYTIFEEESDGE